MGEGATCKEGGKAAAAAHAGANDAVGSAHAGANDAADGTADGDDCKNEGDAG